MSETPIATPEGSKKKKRKSEIDRLLEDNPFNTVLNLSH